MESPQQPTYLPYIKHLRLITVQMGQSDSSEAHIVVRDSFTVGESENGPKYGHALRAAPGWSNPDSQSSICVAVMDSNSTMPHFGWIWHLHALS